MSGEAFLDTNVLIYALSYDESRKAISERLLRHGGIVSVQVLNEFVAVARRKMGMPWEDVLGSLSALRRLCGEPVALTIAIHESALQICKRHRLHIYDSLIVASALDAGCTTIYTEDLQHAQTFGSLTIQNPFLNA